MYLGSCFSFKILEEKDLVLENFLNFVIIGIRNQIK